MEFKASIIIQAPISLIFKQYQDVALWPSWDKDIKYATLDGDFTVGSKGILKPHKGPKSRFTLSEVTTNQSFTTRTKLPLCCITFEHSLKETDSGTHVTHYVIFSGLLSPIFGKLVGKDIQKGLPNALTGLKSVCESKAKGSRA